MKNVEEAKKVGKPKPDQINWNTLKKERLENTNELMRTRGLDLLIATSTDSIQNRGNVRYLTNYSTAFDISIAVVARGADPVLFVPAGSFQAGWALALAWATDVRPVHDFDTAVGSFVRDVGADRASIGLVGLKNLHGSLESSLRNTLSAARFVDVTDDFRLMKSVKTENEILMARQSVQLADTALGDVRSKIQAGVSEREMFAAAGNSVVLGGGEGYFLLGSVGSDNVVMSMPMDRCIEQQDIVRLSVEPSSQGGFWSQIIRTFSLGKPVAEAQVVFDLCAQAMGLLEEQMKPGMVGGELAKAMLEILHRAQGAKVGPLGHGIGLDLTEPPYMLPQDKTTIKPGMVVAVHPHLTWGGFSVWLGDTYLVTENGVERLSTLPYDLLVL